MAIVVAVAVGGIAVAVGVEVCVGVGVGVFATTLTIIWSSASVPCLSETFTNIISSEVTSIASGAV